MPAKNGKDAESRNWQMESTVYFSLNANIGLLGRQSEYIECDNEKKSGKRES